MDRKVEAEGLKGIRRGFLTRFVGDVTGDGVSEILVRDRRERLRLYMLKKLKNSLILIDRPIWERTIEKGALVSLVDESDPTKGLMIREDAQMLVVRFKR